MKKKAKNEIEKTYTNSQTAAKLKRIADAIAEGKPFRIQIGGEKISVPKNAKVSIEYEREGKEEEIEIQIEWKKE